MSLGIHNNITSPLQEEFLYHSSEAKYHSEQYLKACDEAERHFDKWREHAAYKQEFRDKIYGGWTHVEV